MIDRVVVVTGGAAGIGRALVLHLAKEGAGLLVADTDEDGADHVAKEAMEAGAGEAVAVACDVSVEGDVIEAFSVCERRLGPPLGVFANAGVELTGPAHDLGLEVWDKVLRVNLTGVYLTCKHALIHMLATGRGGAIVCTSSPAAAVGYAGGGSAAYGASKGGVSSFVRAIAVEYAQYGIRINSIVPGPTDTRLMWGNIAPEERDEVRALLASEVPLGRLATADEPANAAAWLLSGAASYVTGAELVCDGGVLAKGSVSL